MKGNLFLIRFKIKVKFILGHLSRKSGTLRTVLRIEEGERTPAPKGQTPLLVPASLTPEEPRLSRVKGHASSNLTRLDSDNYPKEVGQEVARYHSLRDKALGPGPGLSFVALRAEG